MKALSMTQPWASLVVLGAKEYETRSWATAHRGPLVIDAARSFPTEAKLLCGRDPDKAALGYDARWEPTYPRARSWASPGWRTGCPRNWCGTRSPPRSGPSAATRRAAGPGSCPAR